ncbi:hypothetical protein ACIP4U_18590 [Streptomyces caelestis]|uniref:hypothetical protein n=1 Tax=Streptomyces caelestis TaxID=36816 RepID=UPI00380A491C
MNYERQPRKPGSSRKSESSQVSILGCSIGLGIVGLIILLATFDILWGDDTWQWAAEEWPGGAYGFAVCVGIGGPCLAVLSVLCLGHMKWKSWRAHPVRTVTNTMVGALVTIALAPYASLVYNAQDTGKWGRGASSSPSWVFSNYPWLWAIGLLSTVATIGVVIWLSVAYIRRQSSAADPDVPRNLDTGRTSTRS